MPDTERLIHCGLGFWVQSLMNLTSDQLQKNEPYTWSHGDKDVLALVHWFFLSNVVKQWLHKLWEGCEYLKRWSKSFLTNTLFIYLSPVRSVSSIWKPALDLLVWFRDSCHLRQCPQVSSDGNYPTYSTVYTYRPTWECEILHLVTKHCHCFFNSMWKSTKLSHCLRLTVQYGT